MGMFGSMGRLAAMMPYEELMRLQQRQGNGVTAGHPDATNMAPPRSMPGIGGGLPANLPVAVTAQPPRGMFAAGGPDYGSHHALHGRGPDGAGGGGKGKFDWTAAALAFANPEAGAMYANRRDKKAAAEASYAEHAALIQNLMRRGMSADDAELAAMNTDKLSEEFNSRFRTREASEGETIRTPGMGAQPDSIWTAPKTFNNGPDVVRYDPQSGMAAPIYQGKTDAQRKLEESGYQPGTPEAFRFMRDLNLNGQGPTAIDMQRERLGQSDLNNRRSTGVSRENSIRSNATSRYNAGNTPLAPVLNQNGDVAIPFRNGQVRSIPGARPIGGGQRGGRSAPAAGGTRIRNPRTGETMVLRNGQWVKE